MPVFEAAFLFRLAPEDFVIAIRIEGRVDVDEINAGWRELSQLVEVVAAVDDAGVDDGRWLGGHAGTLGIVTLAGNCRTPDSRTPASGPARSQCRARRRLPGRPDLKVELAGTFPTAGMPN